MRIKHVKWEFYQKSQRPSNRKDRPAQHDYDNGWPAVELYHHTAKRNRFKENEWIVWFISPCSPDFIILLNEQYCFTINSSSRTHLLGYIVVHTADVMLLI